MYNYGVDMNKKLMEMQPNHKALLRKTKKRS